MISKKTGLAIILFLIVTIGASSMIYTMYRLRHHQEFLSDTAPTVQQVEKAKGETITLTETQGGQAKWVLKMKESKFSRAYSIANLKDIKGMVYGGEKKVLFTFAAPKGTYYKKDNRITLEDGARMTSPTAKVTIHAPHMDWSSEDNRVSASGGVKMMKQDFGVSSAEKAMFALDFSKIEFSGGAKSVIGGHPNTGH